MTQQLTMFEDVLLWSKAVGQYIQQNAGLSMCGKEFKAQGLSMTLVAEEFDELKIAFLTGDVKEIADALADLVWVCLRMAQAFGIDFDAAWCEVSRTNWEKVGGPRREDGKLLKPPGWKPPDMTKALSADLYERIAQLLTIVPPPEKKKCPKCCGEGWVWGRDLDTDRKDMILDDMMYPCDNPGCVDGFVEEEET